MHSSQIKWLASVLFIGLCLANAAKEKRPANRADALKALCQRLEVGSGAVVADVGCGEGLDSMVFAGVVGEEGTVLAQEIDTGKLKKVVEIADRRGLPQVVPVLGQSDDPRLPNGFANLIYMNRVFHHFAQPQAMLKRFWADLRPGGWLVIVDQQKGPLTDWIPLAKREKEHHWTGETTVVRLAREAGFLFHDVLDELWFEKQPFVLAFRKPLEAHNKSGDPDLPLSFNEQSLVQSLPLPTTENATVLFFGLDGGRDLAPALKRALPPSTRFFDVIPSEWAISREELPPGPQLSGSEWLRPEKNDLNLPANASLDLVVFADTYHRLWDPAPILRQLRAHLSDQGRVAVIDREGPDAEPRRLAGHRRRMAAQLVIEDMRKAGFQLQQTLSAPTKDRFFLLFKLDGPSS